MTAVLSRRFQCSLVIASCFLLAASALPASPRAQAIDPSPPDEVVKLIFIHHSTGENWLNDGDGGLARALQANNYFVSDTNYGWGPDAIGDRTDIPDWLTWFRSEDTARYMQALFTENGQNAPYARSLSDPGGENQIVLFKSCFPNSNLDGRPDDAAASDADWTVGGAKYVYNELLNYFVTRPDKLFVVITAPPVSDGSLAENARAFNNWLVHDWLQENAYPLSNVAVFDFYNVLTGPDNHHRFIGGAIEHSYTPGMNTLYYPSSPGDDHPSQAGNHKAAEAFVPLLNVFYHRWQADPSTPAQAEASPPGAVEEESRFESRSTTPRDGLIDDFESGDPDSSDGWEAYMGAETGTHFSCAKSEDNAHAGSSALEIVFDVPIEGWAICALRYGEAQDWSAATGITLWAYSASADTRHDVHLYVGWDEVLETYVARLDATGDWTQFELPWEAFTRVAWEPDAGAPFTATDRVSGLAFGFEGGEDAQRGTLVVDDIRLMTQESPPAEEAPPVEVQDSQETDDDRGRPCIGAFMLPIAALGIFVKRRKEIN